MEHKKLYYEIVQVKNQERLASLLAAELERAGYKMVTLRVVTDVDPPYIYCQVKSDLLFTAVMIGLFADISTLFPDFDEPFYYLPLIAFRLEERESIRRFMADHELSLQHELRHLQDMLALIEATPDYPEKSFEYGLYSVTDPQDLPISIDLEVYKLFYLEPPAMRQDFANGEKWILTPMDKEATKVIRYVCDSVEEYLGLQLDSYLKGIADMYKERFDRNREVSKLIDAEIDKAVNRHGQEVFGTLPVAGRKRILRHSLPKMLFLMATGRFE